MTNKLYLVRGHDVEGENQDWFVIAGDTASATSIWNDHLIENGFPRDEEDDGEELPRTRTVEPRNIREILPDVSGTRFDGPERAVDWDELTVVA